MNIDRFKKIDGETSRLLKLSLFLNLKNFFLTERLSTKQLKQMDEIQKTLKGLN